MHCPNSFVLIAFPFMLEGDQLLMLLAVYYGKRSLYNFNKIRKKAAFQTFLSQYIFVVYDLTLLIMKGNKSNQEFKY